MKLRVNDSFDVTLRDGKWVANIEGVEYFEEGELYEAIKRLIKFERRTKLTVILADKEYNAAKVWMPDLHFWQKVAIGKAIERQATRLDLTIRPGDKVKTLRDTVGINHNVKKGAIGAVLSYERCFFEVVFGTDLVSVTEKFGAANLEKIL